MPIKILKLFSSPPWRRGQGEEGIKFPLLLGGEGRVRRELNFLSSLEERAG